MMAQDGLNQVWVPSRIAPFTDQTPGEGGGEGGPGSGNGVSIPVPPVTPSGDQGTNWKAAYQTLQRNHQTLQEQSTALTSQNTQLTADLATRTSELGDLRTQYENQATTIEGLNTQIQSLTGERDNLNTTLARQQLIMRDFPHLANFEAQGLLPAAENEEALRELLTKFSETVQGIQQSAVESLLDGASPEPVGGEGEGDGKPVSQTADQLWNKLNNLPPSTPQSEFDEVYNQYLSQLAIENGGEIPDTTME